MRIEDCEVVFVAGLPGCGKTAHVERYRQNGWAVFDDFNSMSRHFESLVANIRAGHKCVVADIDFCRDHARIEAEDILRIAAPGVSVGWLFFGNDPRACERNLRHRNRTSLEDDLRCLGRYAPLYSVPSDADALRVWYGRS